MKRVLFCLAATALLTGGPLEGQDNALVTATRAAYDDLDFMKAITLARRALSNRLTTEQQIQVYEIMAFSYGALDSARQAVEAFRQLIFLDPDREPDVNRVSPKITSLYASALGQVLVVRKAGADSTSFVAGAGAIPIRFQVSRASRVTARAVGEHYEAVIDSQLITGPGVIWWGATSDSGTPLPEGFYQVIITAAEGSNEYSIPVNLVVSHSPVDTVQHINSLPGYTFLAEKERPPRTFRPLGISVLYSGLGTGIALALENSVLGNTSRTEIFAIGAAAVATGFAMSIRKPDPVPVPANIRYNRLLREQIAERNRQIAAENELRRRQVLLTIRPAGGGPH